MYCYRPSQSHTHLERRLPTASHRDYSLTPAQRDMRAAVARFSDQSIRPQARAIDAGNYPSDVLKNLAEAGFTRAGFPKDLGGAEVDSVSWALIIAEVARGSGTAGLALGVSGTASLPVLRLATPEQRQLLQPIIKGETPGVYAQSEPEQGSDVAGIKTIARPSVRDGVSGWEISGHKLWISNAWLGPTRRAHWAVVLCQTGEVGNRRTMRFFLVPLDTPGVDVQRVSTNGMRGSGTSQILFDRVFVPEEALLGKDEAGFQSAMQVLGASRIFFSARGLGIVEAAVDLAQEVLLRLHHEDPRDPRLPQGHARLDRLEVDAFNLRVLVYWVARLRDAGESFDHQVAIVKWVAGDTAVHVTSEAYNLIASLGGAPQELQDADRIFRDANQIPLAEGTSEIMERILARDLAGSLRSDGGPTVGRLLEEPGQLKETLVGAQDPPQVTDLLFTLAKAAYREAANAHQGKPSTRLLLPEEGAQGEPEEMSLSPIPSPRQEPLGVERALAALEVTHWETKVLFDALNGMLREGVDFYALEAARHRLRAQMDKALIQAHEVFQSLDDSSHWSLIAPLFSPQEALLRW
ncbi:MAG: hypothetical protein EXR55_05855 [Dehalococcoidia bacterium]|nr:hypothetical protein [Dehalococcoidia bacterium]